MIDISDRARLSELAEAASTAGAAAVDVDTVIACAATALRAHSFDNALTILEAALILDPDHPRAWAMAGLALERLEREDEARSAYEAAIGLDDGDLVTALSLAGLYARRGEQDRARALVTWLLGEVEDAPRIRSAAVALARSLSTGEGQA